MPEQDYTTVHLKDGTTVHLKGQLTPDQIGPQLDAFKSQMAWLLSSELMFPKGQCLL